MDSRLQEALKNMEKIDKAVEKLFKDFSPR